MIKCYFDGTFGQRNTLFLSKVKCCMEVEWMNWRKVLTVVLIITTIILFVVTTRQHDTNLALKEQLGTEYAEKVHSFRNYVEDLQSATDSGDTISTNHFYSEIKAFPVKNDQLIVLLNDINEQLDAIAEESVATAAERKKLSSNLNKLQLTLLDIIAYAKNDSMTWYTIINTKDAGLQKAINHKLN